MDSKQKLKIERNFTYLVDELLVDEITDNLFTEGVIQHDDLQWVNAEKTDRDKASCLINILITTENSYKPFLKEIESSRSDLAEKLKHTDVEEELIKGTNSKYILLLWLIATIVKNACSYWNFIPVHCSIFIYAPSSLQSG